MDRPFGIVLVGHGIAEVDQDSIADIARDIAVVALDRPGRSLLVGHDQVTQILGIEAHGQADRIDKVAEHERELPPLGSVGQGGVGQRSSPDDLICLEPSIIAVSYTHLTLPTNREV